MRVVNDSQGILSAEINPGSLRDRARTADPEDLNGGLVVGEGGLWLRVKCSMIRRVPGGGAEAGLLLQHNVFPSLLFYSSSVHLPKFQLRTHKQKLRGKNTMRVISYISRVCDFSLSLPPYPWVSDLYTVKKKIYIYKLLVIQGKEQGLSPQAQWR